MKANLRGNWGSMHLRGVYPIRLFWMAMLAILAGIAAPAAAQEREVPYWASLRADEVNMRVGPSQDYQVDWIYRRKGLPVKVLRVLEGWRLVQDPDGTQGWMVARLLNPQRTAIVTGEMPVAMHADRSEQSAIKWRLEPGVVGILGQCNDGWCELDVGGRKGFVPQSQLWGAGDP